MRAAPSGRVSCEKGKTTIPGHLPCPIDSLSDRMTGENANVLN